MCIIMMYMDTDRRKLSVLQIARSGHCISALLVVSTVSVR